MIMEVTEAQVKRIYDILIDVGEEQLAADFKRQSEWRYFSKKQLCEHLNITLSGLNQLMDREGVEILKIGTKTVRIHGSEVDKLTHREKRGVKK